MIVDLFFWILAVSLFFVFPLPLLILHLHLKGYRGGIERWKSDLVRV